MCWRQKRDEKEMKRNVMFVVETLETETGFIFAHIWNIQEEIE